MGEDYEKQLAEDPGNPVFAEFAEELRSKGELLQGIDVCLAGLSSNPNCHRGRLALARLFYEKLYIPFCLRELRILAEEFPDNESLHRLIDKLAPAAEGEGGAEGDSDSEEVTIAESEFDFDELDLIEED